MKKYVNFRIEKVSDNQINSQINHNIRKGWQPSYIDLKQSYKNYTLTGIRELNTKEIIKEQNTRSKRKIQKNTDRFFSGIMTFSETMQKDYNREQFDKCSKEFISKIENKFKTKILQAEVHLDEKTPHIHLIFDNIDITGKSTRRKITPEILAECQTIMGECFKPMGYERGKYNSNRTHLSVKQLHELNEKIIELENEVIGYKNELKIFDKILNNEILNEQEKEVLKVLAPALFQFVDKDINKRKQLSNNIDIAIKKRTNEFQTK